MSINATTMKDVKRLCQEVCALISIAEHEMHEATEREGFKHASPHPSKTTGELRRRSMDLSRALSDLRR